MSFWKNLKSQFTGKQPTSEKTSPAQRQKDTVGRTTRASSCAAEPNPKNSPEGCGKLAGDNIPGHRPPEGSRPEGAPEPNPKFKTQNSKFNTPIDHQSSTKADDTQNSFSDTDFDLNDNRNGKIARLPRPLRERINQAIYRRFTAKDLARELNKMPEVKAVLAAHFSGRPISSQNIYEWKWGGYRDWLRRQQILEQQSELTADAKDMADTADGMADSLFGMLTLDYARLMMNRDGDEETFEKKRKALSMLAQDVVRLRRCHLNARRVVVQETKLENETEKTEEQLLLKFTEWTDNPEVRKACILAPMERDRQMRILAGLPPRPEDPLVERETKDDPYFGHFDKNKTGTKPNKTEKSNPQSEPASPPPPTSENKSDVEGQKDTVGPRCGAAESDNSVPDVQVSNDTVGRTTRASCGAAAADREVSPTTASSVPPSNPYAGKATQDIIAECEAKYANEKAARLNPSTHTDNSKLNPQNSKLSDDHHFICRPKPNPLDAFSEPVHYTQQPRPSSPLYGPCEPPLTASSCYNLRPPPGFNSLG